MCAIVTVFFEDIVRLLILLMITLPGFSKGSDIAIGCFVCSSYNGSNPQCDDPFNATALYLSDLGIPGGKENGSEIYTKNCYTGMFDTGTSRGGFYPATHCLKISAIFVTTGETLTIRTCVVDGGSQRIDTEFARRDPATVVAQNSWETHGPFDYESNVPGRLKRERLRGTTAVCSSSNFCNESPSIFRASFGNSYLLIVSMILYHYYLFGL